MRESEQLLDTLDSLMQVLSASGEAKWRKHIPDCRAKIFAGHDTGVTKLLGAYGGMGSLNDLVGSTEDLDQSLRSLLAQSYDLALALRRTEKARGA